MVKSTKRPPFSLAKQTILPWRPLIKYKQGLVCSVHPCGEPAASHFVCYVCGLAFQTKSWLFSHSKFSTAHLEKAARAHCPTAALRTTTASPSAAVLAFPSPAKPASSSASASVLASPATPTSSNAFVSAAESVSASQCQKVCINVWC